MDATMKSARLRRHLPLAALVLATSVTLAMPAAASSVARQEFLSALERGDTDGRRAWSLPAWISTHSDPMARHY